MEQIIESRYVDRKRLVHLLKKEFGVGNFLARVRYPAAAPPLTAKPFQLQLNCWILDVPRQLSEVFFLGVLSDDIC